MQRMSAASHDAASHAALSMQGAPHARAKLPCYHASVSQRSPVADVTTSSVALANKINGDFREEIGWPELVQTVAGVRDSLPPEDRAHLGILGTNYGEAGAVNLYGPQYGLPRAISGVNSFWYRGMATRRRRC
jgi:hypothetical protein